MLNNILIAMGSFKDVFNPKESVDLVKNIIINLNKEIDISSISMADGGEYSHDVVKNNLNCTEVYVHDIITPYKSKVISSYLIFEDNTAFISSSHILRILPELDKYKNPLNLTSYGLGQLIKNAIDKGIKKIFIGLGGTNTIDGGIGMLQALGVTYKDKNNHIVFPDDTKYFSGSDLINIKSIVSNEKEFYEDIEIISLCDGVISIEEMNIPNNQKIGSRFESEHKQIIGKIENGINNYAQIVNIKNRDKFYGVAGGINLSLHYLFNTKMQLGIDFFINSLKLEEKIKKADLVITGEGKLDNSFGGKTPIGISKIAKKYGKPVLYLVGDVEDQYKELFDIDIACDLPKNMQNNGLDAIISCHNYNDSNENKNNLLPKGLMYKKNTQIVFERAIEKYFMADSTHKCTTPN